MKSDVGHTNIWLWLTFPIAILLVIAAGGGIFIGSLYRDNAYYVAQAKGQDIISLLVVFPALVTTALLASRGSFRARLIWLGGLVYLVYTYIIAAFDNTFNSLFLVYVALLGCSLYALIGGLATTNMAEIKANFTEKTPVKTISVYIAILMVLFYFLWLSEVIPALMTGQVPQSIQDNGTPTNAVHVLDMAWILPAFGITAFSLWRKQALGYTLAGALLSYGVILMLAVMSMVVFMMRESQPVAIPQVVVFGVLFIVSFGILIWYLKELKSVPAIS